MRKTTFNGIKAIGFYGDHVSRSLKSVVVYCLDDKSNNLIYDENVKRDLARTSFSFLKGIDSKKLSSCTLQFFINHLNEPPVRKRILSKIPNVGFYGDHKMRNGKFLVAYEMNNPISNLIYQTLDSPLAIHSFCKELKLKAKGISACSLNTYSKKFGHLFN